MRQIKMKIKFAVIGLLLTYITADAQKNSPSKFDAVVEKIQPKCIEWRRQLHENPELGNREFKTAKLIADHLRTLGLEVTEGVAHTGVVGVLKTGKPGPVIGLRADMDALPVTEPGSLSFASKVKTEYNGQQTGVMHACGHDAHVAILMSVAEILSGMKKELSGTVKFIFQPAEEGAPKGEERGAELMIKEGVLENPKVDVMFGLHIVPRIEVGTIRYRPGGAFASATDFRITVKGRSGHGAFPWTAIDPVVVAAQIIVNMQTIVSRNLNITENAGVITIPVINAGNKTNLIPEEVEMRGTLRAMTADDEKMMTDRLKTIALNTAEAAGATATVDIPYSGHTGPIVNHQQLTQLMLPSLQKAADKQNVVLNPAILGADDFGCFTEKVPAMYFVIGGLPKGADPLKASPAHTSNFYIDESGMKTGIKAFLFLVTDYMQMNKEGKINLAVKTKNITRND